jgi:hypothetical protein
VTSQFRLNRNLWLVLAILTLGAAGVGAVAPGIYEGLLSPVTEPGVFTQDIVALLAALLLAVLAVVTKEHHLRRRSVAHGVLGFLFYAYGIYAIERVYSALYPLYLAILAGSLYVLIQGVAIALPERAGALKLPKPVRIAAAVYAIVIAIMFNVIWLSQLVPLIQSRDRIDYLYSIYIIDLSFIMPAFIVTAISAWRNHQLGLIGLPSMFVLGAAILSPLASAELIKPARYGLDFSSGEFWLYLALTILFLAFAVVYLAIATNLKPTRSKRGKT